jgi:hypothetical protein
LVDDFGQRLQFGEQQDVGEFNINLINRIEEGLSLSSPYVPPAEEEEPSAEEEVVPPVLDRKYSSVAKDDQKISYMFFGKQYEVLSYTEEDGSAHEKRQHTIFHQIVVNVDDGNLIWSWDDSCFSSFEYETDHKFKCTAQTETWIDEIPSILSIQVRRIGYDTET